MQLSGAQEAQPTLPQNEEPLASGSQRLGLTHDEYKQAVQADIPAWRQPSPCIGFPVPSIQLSGPPEAQPTLPPNEGPLASGSHSLDLAQAEHKQAGRQSNQDRIARFLEEINIRLWNVACTIIMIVNFSPNVSYRKIQDDIKISIQSPE